MLGPRGGGFIFDTNAVHKGGAPLKSIAEDKIIKKSFKPPEDQLELNRNNLILEFHAGHKIPYLRQFAPGHGLPCPSFTSRSKKTYDIVEKNQLIKRSKNTQKGVEKGILS